MTPCPASTLRSATLAILGIAAIAPAAAQQPADSTVMAQALDDYRQNRLDAAYPLFEALAAAHPGDIVTLTWFAETARRTGHMAEALRVGRTALQLEPCSSFAHSTLGALFNPQYSSYEGTDSDSAWAHIDAAARCNPEDGNVWIPMWVEGMHRGDPALEQHALTRLVETGFLTAGVLELSRWVLSTLPPRAIVFTAGDLDTYPARALQVTGILRPDVGVVNLPLLNLAWYVRHVALVNGLPVPFPDDSLDLLATAGTLGSSTANGWRRMAAQGVLGRPLAIAVTAGQQPDSASLGKLRSEGPYWLVVGSGDSSELDPARVATTLDDLEGSRFVGPWVSEQDRSPVRRAGSIRAGIIPLAVAGLLIHRLRQVGSTAQAEARRAWAINFAREADVDSSLAEQFIDAPTNR